MTTHLRLAKVLEVDSIVRLVCFAYRDYVYLLCNTQEEQLVQQRLKQLVLHADPLPVSLHTFRVMVNEHDYVVGGFAAYPIAKNLQFYQNLYKAVLDYLFFSFLGTEIRINPRLMNILSEDSQWQLPYLNAYYLDVFALDNEFRGRGLSHNLIALVKVRAKEENCTSIVLLAREEMVNFYLHLGFAIDQILEEAREDFFVMHAIL